MRFSFTSLSAVGHLATMIGYWGGGTGPNGVGKTGNISEKKSEPVGGLFPRRALNTQLTFPLPGSGSVLSLFVLHLAQTQRTLPAVYGTGQWHRGAGSQPARTSGPGASVRRVPGMAAEHGRPVRVHRTPR